MNKVLLQPLRVPPCWLITWNTLFEIDPTPENVRAGFFGGSSLFGASSQAMRLAIDVEWRPEDDPNGEYLLFVYYLPWERTENGRRRKDVPMDWTKAQVVLDFATQERARLVQELEAAFCGRPEWIEHT